MSRPQPFWRTLTLAEMSEAQWESLCDGCGKCCLHKLENEETGDVFYTRVACELLDLKTGRCRDYAHRFEKVPDCIDLRAMEEQNFYWLPATCAYRRVQEGLDLPDWHHLVSGRTALVHKLKRSIRGRAIPESEADLDNLEAEIIRWVDT